MLEAPAENRVKGSVWGQCHRCFDPVVITTMDWHVKSLRSIWPFIELKSSTEACCLLMQVSAEQLWEQCCWLQVSVLANYSSITVCFSSHRERESQFNVIIKTANSKLIISVKTYTENRDILVKNYILYREHKSMTFIYLWYLHMCKKKCWMCPVGTTSVMLIQQWLKPINTLCKWICWEKCLLKIFICFCQTFP